MSGDTLSGRPERAQRVEGPHPRMVRLGEVLEEFVENAGGRDLPVLTLTEKNGFVRQDERFHKRLAVEDTGKYKVVHCDDIAFNPYLLWAGALAQNQIVDAGIISPLYPTFHVREGVNPKYLYRILLSQPMIDRYDSISFGSVPRRRRSSVKDFLRLQIRELPPLPEERRIVSILDRADAIRAKRRQVLSDLDELKRSVFDSMFPVGSYEQLPIGAFADVLSGATPLRSESSYFDGDIPWVKTGEVHDETIFETEEHVSVEGMKAAHLRLYPKKSIIVAMYGQGKTRGQSAILGIDATTNQACAVIPPNDRFDSVFLQSQFAMSYERLRNQASGSNQPNLSAAKIKAMRFMLPPLSLQREFASRVERIDAIRAKVAEALKLDDELFASLQSRAFRGEL